MLDTDKKTIKMWQQYTDSLFEDQKTNKLTKEWVKTPSITKMK